MTKEAGVSMADDAKGGQSVALGNQPWWRRLERPWVLKAALGLLALELAVLVPLAGLKMEVERRPFLIADKASLVFERVDANVWLDERKSLPGVFKGHLGFLPESARHGRMYLVCVDESTGAASYARCPMALELRAMGMAGPVRADLEVAKIDYRWFSWAMEDYYVLRSHAIRRD